MQHLFWHKKRKLFNKAISSLLLISGFFMFAFAMFSPIYAIFVEKIGGGIREASNAWALFGLTAGLLTFVAGKYENQMKETELAIAWSQFVIGLAYVMLFFTFSVKMLYIVMIILGIGEAIFWPAFHSVYGKHVDHKKSVWQWSLYDGLAYVIPAGGSALGGWLVAVYGFNLIFIIMAAISFACGLFILVLPRKIL